jgi:hypothetical protein
MNERMNADHFYQQCCITGRRTQRIERHHNLIFADKQASEYWAILPLVRARQSPGQSFAQRNLRLVHDATRNGQRAAPVLEGHRLLPAQASPRRKNGPYDPGMVLSHLAPKL